MGSIEGGDKNEVQIFGRNIQNNGRISGGKVTIVTEQYSGKGEVTSHKPPVTGKKKEDWSNRWFGKIIIGVVIAIVVAVVLHFSGLK